MHCKQVKRRILEQPERLDPQLIEHLRSCEACARTARAQQVLAQVLDSKHEESSLPSYESVRTSVQARAVKETRWRKLWKDIRFGIGLRPAFTAGISVVAVLLAVVTIISFTYTTTVGYEITIPGVEGSDRATPALLSATVSAIGYDDVRVRPAKLADTYTLSSMATASEAQQLAVALSAMTGANGEPEVKAIRRKLAWSLYSKATGKRVSDDSERIRVRFVDGQLVVDGADDAESFVKVRGADNQIVMELEGLMMGMGFDKEEYSVSAWTEPDSSARTIKVELIGDGSEPESEADIQVWVDEGDVAAQFDDSDTSVKGRNVKLDFNGHKTLSARSVTIKILLKPDNDSAWAE